MRVHCPFCQNGANVEPPRPGHFTVKCHKCGKTFGVDLRADATAALQVSAPKDAPPRAAQVAATMPPTSAAAGRTMPPRSGNGDAMHTAPPPSNARLINRTSAPPSSNTAAPQRTRVPHFVDGAADQSFAASSVGTRVDPYGPGNGAGETAPPSGAMQARRLGGYDLLAKLGEGGMGAVYLARQVSLDRRVALKVLAPFLASDPQFVVRFTREAYAAAQLTHHNIVAIHDIGSEAEEHFFSMEFVEGQTLNGALKESGKFDPEAACSYTLQAARGLQFAHEHGMIHRDIKPDNLLLNDQGIVKVADLGLVKRRGQADEKPSAAARTAAPQSIETTQLNVSMGTPAYMPPEQSIDAAHVDARADIYSLGCTLYALLTGRPPFMGRSAAEVISKHQREPATPPEMIVRSVPKTLSTIVMKMIAKKPDERFLSMAQVVGALEDFLGVASHGVVSAREEQAKIIENASTKFSKSAFAVLRMQLAMAFFAVCAIGIALLAFLHHPLAAGSLFGFALLTTLSYQLLINARQKTYMFEQARGLAFGASVVDWLIWLVIAGVVIFILQATGWLLPWLGVGAIAIGAAAGFHFAIDSLVTNERRKPVEDLELLLKQQRARGMDEAALRQMIFKFSGPNWEELYETLFGYQAKIKARQLFVKGDAAHNRRRWAAWRDGIILWMEQKQALRRARKEQKFLQKVEQKALQSGGMSESEAAEQARQHARRIMNTAAKIREHTRKPAQQKKRANRMGDVPQPAGAAGGGGEGMVYVPSDWMKQIGSPNGKLNDDDFERERISFWRRRFGTPMDMIFGAKLRFILAAVLLTSFGLWMHANNKTLEQASDFMTSQRSVDPTNIKEMTLKAKTGFTAERQTTPTDTKTLTLPFVPQTLNEALSGWNAAVAGAILLLSCLATGRLMAGAVIVSAIVALIGHWIALPAVGYPAWWMAAAVGAVLGAFAMIFFRSVENA